MHHQSIYGALADAYQDEQNQILSRSIFGTTDASQIAEEIHRLCLHCLDSRVQRCLLVEFSVGASFGLELTDGRQIFLKLNNPNNESTFIMTTLDTQRAIATIQRQLANSGFPCPRVIHEPVSCSMGIATFDSYEDVGEPKDAHDSRIRQSIARTLADLIRRADYYKSTPYLAEGKLFTSHTLYPTPHNALFDFGKAAGEVEWIDDIAMRAKQIIENTHGNIVLGHGDWSLKHFRFRNDDIIMVYDWDSLLLEDELNLLGVAAATFTTTWDIDTKITPSPEECHHFIREYERERNRPFQRTELSRIEAAITYCMAYIARCEYALDPTEERFNGSFRQTLRIHIGMDGLYPVFH